MPNLLRRHVGVFSRMIQQPPETVPISIYYQVYQAVCLVSIEPTVLILLRQEIPSSIFRRINTRIKTEMVFSI